MPTFQYQPLADLPAATIDAPSRAAAISTLRQRGILPVRIDEIGTNGSSAAAPAARSPHRAKPATTRSFSNPFADAADKRADTGDPSTTARGGGMSRADMASFMHELATAVGAGLPLVQALKVIARQGRKGRRLDMLRFLIHEVEHGRSLGDAAASWGKPFADLTINLIRAGEASGRMPEVLEQAATLLDSDLKLRRSLTAATVYPAMLLCLVVAAVTLIITFIVPTILKPVQGLITRSQLPAPTRVVLAIGDAFNSYWWLILGGAAALVLFYTRIIKDPAVRLSIDRAILAVPVLGRLIRDVAVARFTRTLGTLVGAGLPVLLSLRITKATLGNKAMERVIDDVAEGVSSGETIADPLERSGMFPPLLVQIIGLGERSGRLREMLGQAANAFESRTESSIKLFTSVLPPLLVILMAVVIGFVLAAVMLPMLELQELMQ